MIHIYKLSQKSFLDIKNNDRTIEVRLFDDKRRMVNVGDTIEFYFNMDHVSKTVVSIHIFENFELLVEHFTPKKFGVDNCNDFLNELKLFYPNTSNLNVVAFDLK